MMRWTLLLACFAAATLAAPFTATALPSVPAGAGDMAGAAVAMDAYTMASSMPGNSSVQMFARDASTAVWTASTRLQPWLQNSTLGAAFGASISVGGGVVVVGSPSTPAQSTAVGSAFVYAYNATAMQWMPSQQLFGCTAAYAATHAWTRPWLALTTPQDDVNSIEMDIFFYNSSTSSFHYSDTLDASDFPDFSAAENGLGAGSVLLDVAATEATQPSTAPRTCVLVGAANGTEGGRVAGVCKTTDWNTTSTSELSRPSMNANAGFGTAIAISGDMLVVGAPGFTIGNTASGAIVTYIRSASSGPAALNSSCNGVASPSAGWVCASVFTPSGAPFNNSRFGAAVALSGSYLTVGAPAYGNGAGWTGVFFNNGTASAPVWQMLTGVVGAAGSASGAAVAMSSDVWIGVGAPHANVSAKSMVGAAGLLQRVQCPPHQQVRVGSVNLVCDPCDPGTASSTFAAVCSPCPAGSSGSGGVCSVCDYNTYTNSSGWSSCFPCPAGSVANVTNSTSCFQCLAGFYANSTFNRCEGCPPGSYSASPGAATSASCVLCGLGTASNAIGASICPPCATDHYAADQGAQTCAACPVGGAAIAGSSECLCASGYYLNSTRGCDLCPSMTACQRCAQGVCFCNDGYTWDADHICQPCPGGAGVKCAVCDATTCVCNPGFYNDANYVCTACPTGATCPGFGQPAAAAPGYWHSSSDPLTFVACTPAARCPGGVADTCGEGYTGNACSQCLPGYAEDRYTGYCSACSKGASPFLFIFFAYIFLFAVFMIRMAYKFRQWFGAFIVSYQFLQLVGFLGVVPGRWSNGIRQLFAWISLVNFDIDFTQPECSIFNGGARTFEDVWPFRFLLVFFVLAVYVGLYPLLLIMMKCCGKKYSRKRITRATLNAFVCNAIILVVPVVLMGVEPLRCNAVTGQWAYNIDLNCNTMSGANRTIGITVGVLYLGLVPLIFTFGMCVVKDHLTEANTVWLCGLSYKRFKGSRYLSSVTWSYRQCLWWIIPLILDRIFNDVYVTFGVYGGLGVLWIVFNVFLDPFERDAIRKLDDSLSVVMIVLLLAGIINVFHDDPTLGVDGVPDNLGTIIVAVVVALLLIVLIITWVIEARKKDEQTEATEAAEERRRSTTGDSKKDREAELGSHGPGSMPNNDQTTARITGDRTARIATDGDQTVRIQQGASDQTVRIQQDSDQTMRFPENYNQRPVQPQLNSFQQPFPDFQSNPSIAAIPFPNAPTQFQQANSIQFPQAPAAQRPTSIYTGDHMVGTPVATGMMGAMGVPMTDMNTPGTRRTDVDLFNSSSSSSSGTPPVTSTLEQHL